MSSITSVKVGVIVLAVTAQLDVPCPLNVSFLVTVDDLERQDSTPVGAKSSSDHLSKGLIFGGSFRGLS